MRPIVCLTLPKPTVLNEQSTLRYRSALEAAGAEVVAVHPNDSPPSQFDALLLSGGGDVESSRYGALDIACTNVDRDRDELELALLRRATDLGLPVLGICRGFQLINVFFGGGLEQDLGGHQPDDPVHGVVHHEEIRPLIGSRLWRAIGDGPLTVNSRHHQAVTHEVLAPSLQATAESGGIIEALEATMALWIVGVQWHPERKGEVSAEAAQLFDTFVAEAARATASADFGR